MATVTSSRGEGFARPAPGAIRVHLDHLRDPIGHFDLPELERDLRHDVAMAREGQTAVTLVKYPDLRVVLITLARGAVLAESRTAARISIQALRGHVELRLPEGILDVAAGHLATLEGGTEFCIGALTDSAILLTLSWPRRSA
jgi:hypothetical protein